MKSQVHYAELEDMRRNIKDFNPDNYISCSGKTDPSITEYVRKYYDEHLPVDVTSWVRVNNPDERLIYAKGLGEQVCFVRDRLCSLFMPTYEEKNNNFPMVISTHYSKSVKLPVFQINLAKYGIEIILRYNFYDWKISINSKKPLDFDYMGIFNPTQEIPSPYCEGFPKEKIYGSYNQSHSQFTIEFSSHYNLYVFMFLLNNYLNTNK